MDWLSGRVRLQALAQLREAMAALVQFHWHDISILVCIILHIKYRINGADRFLLNWSISMALAFFEWKCCGKTLNIMCISLNNLTEDGMVMMPHHQWWHGEWHLTTHCSATAPSSPSSSPSLTWLSSLLGLWENTQLNGRTHQTSSPSLYINIYIWTCTYSNRSVVTAWMHHMTRVIRHHHLTLANPLALRVSAAETHWPSPSDTLGGRCSNQKGTHRQNDPWN